MEERLLFDGISAKTGRATIRRQDDPLVARLAHEAKAMLTGTQRAAAWAEIALKTAIGGAMPPLARNDARRQQCAFVHGDLL
jgi:hypothetical protein